MVGCPGQSQPGEDEEEQTPAGGPCELLWAALLITVVMQFSISTKY